MVLSEGKGVGARKWQSLELHDQFRACQGKQHPSAIHTPPVPAEKQAHPFHIHSERLKAMVFLFLSSPQAPGP